MPALLTKSDLLSAVQCPRKLWLEHRRPDLTKKDDASAERRQREGLQVGDLARKQMGPYVLFPATQVSKEVSALKAKETLLSDRSKAGVEFPFYFDDVYARADAIIPDEFSSDGYVLRETKATTYPLSKDKVTTGKPDINHLIDLGIQAFVMESSGIPLARAQLNLLNNQWRYEGTGNYSGLFRILDVTPEVREVIPLIPSHIERARAILEGQMPDLVTGKQCKDPHGCPYIAFCEKIDPPKPEHPLELLPDAAGKRLAATLKKEKGYTSLLQPKESELTGASAALYLRMQEAHRSGLPFLSPFSGEELKELPYPRYYFDFEGIDLAVPVWKGVRPYEQIPFQWSCHIEVSPGVFRHDEFLDLSGEDPSLGCIHKLLETIDVNGTGPIFVYFATYERGRLQELGLRHPEYAGVLDKYISRLVDLLPLVKKNFYHPKMEGSFSIKKVLPVIAPDLDYSDLTEVTDGVAAQIAFIKSAILNVMTPEEKEETEKNSLIYCCQDTWAMVEVAYFLEHKPRPFRPAGM